MIVYKTQRLFLENWELEDFASFAAITRDSRVIHSIATGIHGRILGTNG